MYNIWAWPAFPSFRPLCGKHGVARYRVSGEEARGRAACLRPAIDIHKIEILLPVDFSPSCLWEGSQRMEFGGGICKTLACWG